MDYTEIQKQFNQIISYSQHIPNPKTDELFANWYKAKKDFIEAFGGQLIYEVPGVHQFTLDSKKKNSLFNEYVNTVVSVYHNYELGEFLEAQRDGFFTNSVTADHYLSSGKKINKGTKLLKSFKYFINEDTTLKQLQNQASMLIQQEKVEGILCFSVHPLDFLSSSENNCNWRSCHSLDGDFRAGNLSYMTDSCTVMCYLKGANDEILNRFPDSIPWNSKKWRMLLYFSKERDMVMASRQYPFFTKAGLDLILEELKTFFPQFYYSRAEWKNDWITSEDVPYYLEDKYLPFGGRLYRDNSFIFDAGEGEALHFNDILYSSCYNRPYYLIVRHVSFEANGIFVGRDVTCLKCGKHYISKSGMMTCGDCEESDNYIQCEFCGGYIEDYDIYTLQNGIHICSYCADKYTIPCYNCGVVILESDAHNYEGKFYCYDCYKEIEEE